MCSATRKFTDNSDLLFYLANNIYNRPLLLSLCLVNHNFNAVFKQFLWRDMTLCDFYPRGSKPHNLKNLRYTKTYEDIEYRHLPFRTLVDFTPLLSKMDNLELVELFEVENDLLGILSSRPKLRGLHLSTVLPPPPNAFDKFRNLTHLLLDGLDVGYSTSFCRKMVLSLSALLIRSPQLRELGLRQFICFNCNHFVLLSDEFSKDKI
ncbi:hypothetical protein V8F06_014654 [Rhypophila decipiens]